MKNITLAIDETLLERARGLAARRRTSLNAIVRNLLANEVEQEERIAQAKLGLKDLMENSRGRLPADYEWSREEIYAEREDRLSARHQRPDLRGFGED